MNFDELWKPVNGYENLYLISNKGRLKSCNRTMIRKDRWGNETKYQMKSKVIKIQKNNKGYNVVNLYKKGKGEKKLIHRLVASAFIPNLNNLPEVNHKDENKQNNIVDNLEWCERNYNNNYGKQSKIGRRLSSEKRMKKVNQYDLNGNLIKNYKGVRIAEEETGVHNSNIIKCCNNKVKSAGGYVWKYQKESS